MSFENLLKMFPRNKEQLWIFRRRRGSLGTDVVLGNLFERPANSERASGVVSPQHATQHPDWRRPVAVAQKEKWLRSLGELIGSGNWDLKRGKEQNQIAAHMKKHHWWGELKCARHRCCPGWDGKRQLGRSICLSGSLGGPWTCQPGTHDKPSTKPGCCIDSRAAASAGGSEDARAEGCY